MWRWRLNSLKEYHHLHWKKAVNAGVSSSIPQMSCRLFERMASVVNTKRNVNLPEKRWTSSRTENVLYPNCPRHVLFIFIDTSVMDETKSSMSRNYLDPKINYTTTYHWEIAGSFLAASFIQGLRRIGGWVYSKHKNTFLRVYFHMDSDLPPCLSLRMDTPADKHALHNLFVYDKGASVYPLHLSIP